MTTEKKKTDRREKLLLAEKMEKQRERMRAQLKEWGVDLEILEHRAKKASDEARAEYEKQVSVLSDKLDEAKTQMKERRKRSVAASDEMLHGMDNAWSELSKAFESAAAKLTKGEHETASSAPTSETPPHNE